MKMCSTNGNSSAALLPFGMKLAGQAPYLSLSSPHLGLELQRAQLQEYTQRLQLGLRSFPGQMSSLSHFSYHGHLTNPYLHPYFYKDPRARFIHEEPKPNHSYIGLIAMAILSSREKKLVLSDIYQWILDNYSYFRTRGPGWRNSIRHNLSLNDCFIKAGRSANGKGHYWAIHPANTEDFQKGDFRRRRAQRRVRKHMGLSVPDDDDDDDSPAPSPVTAQAQQALHWDVDKVIDCTKDDHVGTECHSPITEERNAKLNTSPMCENNGASPAKRPKRLFDMESILAPDDSTDKKSNNDGGDENTQCNTQEDIVANTGNPSGSDTDNTDIKRHAIDLTLSRDIVDNERYIKRPYSGMVLNGNDVIKSPSSHSPVTSGKTLPYIPQLISGIHRGAELQNRVSAFRNAGAYSWASLSGYLSSYQLMALSNQNQTLIQRSVLEGDSGSRWHQPANSLASQALSTKDQSPQSQSHDE